jgi:hypothetical protein
LVVLILTARAELQFRSVRNELGKLLMESEELAGRSVYDQEQYARWNIDFNDWVRRVQQFLITKLSPAHAAMFRNLSEGGSYMIQGAVNQEYSQLMNDLRKYVNNLKLIVDRYLTARA